MVTISVTTLPPAAVQNVAREKRIYKRDENQKFVSSSGAEKKATKDLKVSLCCKDHNLVALWFLSLGLSWKKGAGKGNASLTTALYKDLEERGFHVEDTTWTAYRQVMNRRYFWYLT